MDKNSKIFIAGHGGLVWSAIVRKFRSEWFENLILRTRAELDLRDSAEVEKFFLEQKPEYVILSAAKVGWVASHAAQHFDMLYENLQIQNSVIHAAYANQVKRLLFIASGTVYPTDCPQPISESSLLQGPLDSLHESYGLAKICWLKLCEKVRLQSDLEFFTLVPTNMYGEGDTFDEKRSSVMSSLIRRFHVAKLNGDSRVEVWWTWKAMREFLYVDDMADAVHFFLENPPLESYINIWSDQEITVRELAEKIKETVGYEGDIFFDTSKPEWRLKRKLDTRLAEKYSWKSCVTLEEGLKKTYKYFISK